MIWIQISVFVGTVGLAWLAFHYAGTVYEKRKKLSVGAVLVETFVFLMHGAASAVYLDWSGEGSGENQLLIAGGAVLIAVGLVGTITAMRHLGWRATFGQGTGTETTGARPVANRGLYSYSRNPQLVFYALFLAGCVLLWPSWGGLVWLVLYAVIAVLMVRTEEKHLQSAYPDDFNRYAEQVPRWLGPKREGPLIR